MPDAGVQPRESVVTALIQGRVHGFAYLFDPDLLHSSAMPVGPKAFQAMGQAGYGPGHFFAHQMGLDGSCLSEKCAVDVVVLCDYCYQL